MGDKLDFPVCPGNCVTRDTQTLGLWGTSWTSRCVQVTVVHGILRHQVCGGQVGHPGIVAVCPGNCGTLDTQRLGLWGASWHCVQVTCTRDTWFVGWMLDNPGYSW